MSVKTLDKITYLYLILPLCIFLINWLNPVVASIALISLIIILKFTFKDLLNRKLEITKYQLILVISIAALWCVLAGIGGLYYQSPDWHWRNAIFRDLINFSHPVIYDNGAALVYYFGLFLPAAIVGKLMLFFGSTPELAFKIGNLFNLLYSVFGIVLVFLQTLLLTNAKKKHIFIVIFLFILFSGLDILYGKNNSYEILHIEWHKHGWQFSSNTTLLFWVYNQTIAPWLITALFLRRSFNISNYGFLAALGLFYAPLPFAGLCLYLSFMAICRFIIQFTKKHLKWFFKDLFNIKNFLSIFILMPIFYCFYSSNITANEHQIYIINEPFNILKFVFIEFGFYFFFIGIKNLKNPLYYISLFSLFFVLFFKIGDNIDFCMRASIPALFVMFILVIKYLFDSNRLLLGKILLSVTLLLGMVTPYFEFYRGYFLNYVYFAEPQIKDEMVTLNKKINKNCVKEFVTVTDFLILNFGNYKNYGAVDLDKHIFFKYLAKKPRR